MRYTSLCMSDKVFCLPSEAIKPDLAPGRGSCLASDLITVTGYPVGFMYRADPDNELDSGWRFFAGTESTEYCDDPANFEMYDVNTIANHDPGIIPLLDSEPGSAFERQPESVNFVPTEFPPGANDD
jgi:hypothetical protein